MKIAWYTPFSVQSAIGRFSALVLEQLAQWGVDVTVVRSETPSRALRQLATHPTQAPVLWAHDLGPHPEKRLAEYDLVVFNIGDYFTYHEYCFYHLERVPGIVVLHDYVLHNALNGYCHAKNTSSLTYEAVLEEECGVAALEAMLQHVHTEPHLWWQQGIVQFPVLRWALRNALGVVVHSAFTGGHVRSRVACPMREIPLAYDGGDHATMSNSPASKSKVRLLTVGHINPNKRVREVVEVLAANDRLRANFDYHVVGPIEDQVRSAIEAAAGPAGRQAEIVLTGRVEDAQLREEFQQADAIMCLRNPAMEGGSASVIEGLLTGKPVIVSDTGCFAEIPDNYVYKVDSLNESAQLRKVLTAILDDYAFAIRRGQQARDWARRHHSAENYAHAFLNFAERVLYDVPVLRTIDRLGEMLRIAGVAPSMDLLGRIDTAMGDVFRDGRRAQRIADHARDVISSE